MRVSGVVHIGFVGRGTLFRVRPGDKDLQWV
jgi:hypothetical protein